MRTRIVVRVLACGLPVLLLALVGLWRYLDSAKQGVIDDRLAMAQAASLTTQAFVADVTTSAQIMALTPALLDPAQRAAHNQRITSKTESLQLVGRRAESLAGTDEVIITGCRQGSVAPVGPGNKGRRIGRV